MAIGIGTTKTPSWLVSVAPIGEAASRDTPPLEAALFLDLIVLVGGFIRHSKYRCSALSVFSDEGPKGYCPGFRGG